MKIDAMFACTAYMQYVLMYFVHAESQQPLRSIHTTVKRSAADAHNLICNLTSAWHQGGIGHKQAQRPAMHEVHA